MSESADPPRSFVKLVMPWAMLAIAVAVVASFAIELDPPAPTRRAPESTAASATIVKPKPAPAANTPRPEPTKQASTKVEPAVFDYGWLAPGEVKVIQGTITNTGDESINFTGRMKGCSCTTVDLPKGDLAPGDTIDFSATMTAGLTPTTKKSSFSLVLADHVALRVPVDGEIIRGVQVQPRRMSAVGKDPANPQGPDVPVGPRRAQLNSPTRTPFRVLRMDGTPVEHFPGGERFLNPVPQHAFIFDDFDQYDPVTGLDAKGNMVPAYRLLETDHAGAEVVEIPVDHPALRAKIERRGERTWLYTEQRVVVPPVQPGAMAVYEIPVKRVGPGREMISSMESESPDVFDAQLLGVRQEGRETIVRFGITPKLAQDGAYMGNVRFRSEQFSAPLVVIGAVRAPGATP